MTAPEFRLETVGHPEKCPRADLHTKMPADYLWWHEWAEEMAKTHDQEQCPGCGFWRVWVARSVNMQHNELRSV